MHLRLDANKQEHPPGPIMFYRYDLWLTDDSGHLLSFVFANVLGSHFRLTVRLLLMDAGSPTF